MPTDISCPAYKYDKENVPSIIVSASKSSSGTVNISLCNLDPNNDVKLDCKLEGLKPNKVIGRVLTAETMNAHNTFENPDTIKPTTLKNITIKDNLITVTIPSKSVVVLAVQQ